MASIVARGEESKKRLSEKGVTAGKISSTITKRSRGSGKRTTTTTEGEIIRIEEPVSIGSGDNKVKGTLITIPTTNETSVIINPYTNKPYSPYEMSGLKPVSTEQGTAYTTGQVTKITPPTINRTFVNPETGKVVPSYIASGLTPISTEQGTAYVRSSTTYVPGYEELQRRQTRKVAVKQNIKEAVITSLDPFRNVLPYNARPSYIITQRQKVLAADKSPREQFGELISSRNIDLSTNPMALEFQKTQQRGVIALNTLPFVLGAPGVITAGLRSIPRVGAAMSTKVGGAAITLGRGLTEATAFGLFSKESLRVTERLFNKDAYDISRQPRTSMAIELAKALRSQDIRNTGSIDFGQGVNKFFRTRGIYGLEPYFEKAGGKFGLNNDTGLKAMQIEKGSTAYGSTMQLVYLSSLVEEFGRSSIKKSLEKGGFVSGKAGLSSTIKKATTNTFRLGGFVEGFGQSVGSDVISGRGTNYNKSLLAGVTGAIVAPWLGRKILTQSIKGDKPYVATLANIFDPAEKPGDILADFGEAATEKIITPTVKVVTPTFGENIYTFKADVQKLFLSRPEPLPEGDFAFITKGDKIPIFKDTLAPRVSVADSLSPTINILPVSEKTIGGVSGRSTSVSPFVSTPTNFPSINTNAVMDTRPTTPTPSTITNPSVVPTPVPTPVPSIVSTTQSTTTTTETTTNLITNTRTQTPITTSTSTNVFTSRIAPPSLFPRGGLLSGSGKRYKSFKLKKGYTPSLTALAFNIRGKKPSERLTSTGLFTRPLPKKKKVKALFDEKKLFG